MNAHLNTRRNCPSRGLACPFPRRRIVSLSPRTKADRPSNNNSDSFYTNVCDERVVPRSLNRANDLDPPPYTVFSRERSRARSFPSSCVSLIRRSCPYWFKLPEGRREERRKSVVRHWQFTGKSFVFLRWGMRGSSVG